MEPADSVIMSTIKKGDLVLVTGVTGYIATHVADQLLAAGYNVRGTARTKDKAAWMVTLFEEKYGGGRFEVVEVPDMAADNAFDTAVTSVSGICHVASVVTFSSDPDAVIAPTVKGALNILTSASKTPSLKSLVYTSSSTAATMPPTPNESGIIIQKSTWNDYALDAVANNSGPSAFDLYAASKTAAEQAIWKCVADTHPPFQVATVLPNMNIGPILNPDTSAPASTAGWVRDLYTGSSRFALSFPVQNYINVVDCARLHVVALIDPKCNGERIFGFAGPFTWEEILGTMREVGGPERTLPELEEGSKGLRDLSVVEPREEAEELLRKHYGKGWTGLEESVRENLAGVA